MKLPIELFSTAAVTLALCVGSARADDEMQPSKVTGGGKYQELEGWPTMDVAGEFSLTINPNQAPGKKSPQAVIHLDGPVLREIWGERLVIQGDYDGWFPIPFGETKPAQVFVFFREHPTLGSTVIYVFTHDNVTPGYNSADPLWSDWIMVIIEGPDGDGDPFFSGDELYLSEGIVVKGNLMDHRKQ